MRAQCVPEATLRASARLLQVTWLSVNLLTIDASPG